MELFRPNLKNKKNSPQENSLYSEKMELSNSNIKKFLIFQVMETPKKILIFSQKNVFL